jgi:hypothetical protein
MEDPDFGYTIDQHLAPTGAMAARARERRGTDGSSSS